MKQTKNTDEAISALNHALTSLDNESLPISDRLELFRTAAGLLDRSRADLIKRAAAWNGVGVCLYRAQAGSKAEEEAFSHALNLLRRSPDGAHGEFAASVLSNLGECCLRAGKRDRAYELYSRSLDELRPLLSQQDDGCERYAICACAKAQCKPGKDSRRELEQEIKLIGKCSRKNPRRLKALGICHSVKGAMLYREGNARSAVRSLSKAAELYTLSGAAPGELGDIYVNLAKANETCGRISAAAQQVQLSIELMLAEYPQHSSMLSIELANRSFSLAGLYEQLGDLERAAQLYDYCANFLHNCTLPQLGGLSLSEREALSHYLCASCYVRMSSPLYYNAMQQYDRALKALSACGGNVDSQRRLILAARADIYEAFGESKLAAADYTD